MRFHVVALCAWLVLGALAQSPAQDRTALTLDQALKLAKARNGAIRAAQFDLEAAKSGANQALAAFFPTVTPVYQYNSDRSSVLFDGTRIWQQTEGGTTFVSASWKMLDFGQRELRYRSARQNAASSAAQALQTLRSTLFDVYVQYVEVLRAQELLKVADAQVQRSNLILEQTRAQVKVGEVAAKEVLQAEADALNSKVSYLTAKNRSSNATASLGSAIGWDSGSPLPALTTVEEPAQSQLPPLDALIRQGVSDRQDLIAARRSLTAMQFNKQLADRNAGPTLSLDGTFNKTLTPNTLESRALTLTLNGPFFDGGLARAQARQAAMQYLSAQASYVQQERSAKAEIEAVAATDGQNAERIAAAKSAREAAGANYKAAVESQKAGAANLIDVLTAQVSLATAESNYIEALYDFLESETRLKLVTGQAVPGEA